MKRIKNLVFFIIAVLLAFGIFSNIKNQKEYEIKTVTFYELQHVVEKNKGKKLVMHEKEDGMVILKINNTIYQTSVKPTENSISDLTKEYNIEYRYVKSSGFFETIFKLFVPFLFIFFIIFILFNRNKAATGRANEMVKKHTKKSDIPSTKLEDIGGLSEETMGEIRQIIGIFKNKEQAKLLGIRPARGALLYGPPGTGKTLLAKAIASELGANFYSASGSSFVEMFVGVGASRIRELFEEARKNKPSMIFIDEIDSLAKKRGLGHSNEERESTLNELLKQLDGIESNEDVFLIGATNRMDILDEAVVRPGRFDYKIMIGLPDLEGRKEIIQIHSKNKRLSENVMEKMDLIAESSIGYSGADIEGVFNNAAKKALAEERTEIEMDDINYALDLSILGNANRKLKDEDTKTRVAYHEAGHALVGLITKPKSVRKATIIPRGQALGFVAPIPKEMELSTSSELIGQISMILAGGVAEMKKFGEHSIGVSGDVQQAKNIIEKMVELGMREDDFILTFEEEDKQKLMKKIYKEALDNCKEIMFKHEAEWIKLAEALLEKETLSGEEIERIVYNLPEPAEEKFPVNEEKEVKNEDEEQDGKTILKGKLEKSKL